MPAFISKKIIKNSENSKHPVWYFGAATFFLPCGFTQSMQLYALSTGDFLRSGSIMLIFALGTLPVLTLITQSSKIFSVSKHRSLFFKTVGILILVSGVYSLFNALSIIKILLRI